MLTQIEHEEEVAEVTSHANKVAVMAQTLDGILSHSMPDAVYWMESTQRSPRRVSLHAAPIDIAEGLRNYLFEKFNSVVMTSATLCAAGNASAGKDDPLDEQATVTNSDPRFAYIRSRLGVVRDRTLALGSPFDYQQQATLYLETDLPDPSDTMRFFPAACERIEHYVRQSNGGAFVLFTSYKMLRDSASRLRPQLEHAGFPVLVHGEGAPRKILLERFRSQENAVLFGTASFWQGIDVQGDALRNVIITKLPFAVPDEPIVEAQLEMIQRRGGNPFMEYSVPEAVIRLKQGFGRLIRSRSDRGIVVILDGRVMTKRYGRVFLDALPDCRRVIVGRSATP